MILQTEQEIKNLLYHSFRCRDILGDMVEVGVYRGGSAEVINFGKPIGKTLHLYDTFGPSGNGFDDQFDWTHAAKDIILNIPGCYIHIGEFDGANVPHPISFAHIDVDSDSGTYASLEQIYPSMSVGGAIIVHDYQNGSLRVRDAVDRFMLDKAEVLTALNQSTQCVIIKQ